MKYRLLICLLLSLPGLIRATSPELRRLDKTLGIDYITVRNQRLDSLKETTTRADSWKLYYDLAGQYADLNTDSALHYNRLASAIAGGALQRAKTDVQRASLYNSSLMMYKEAFETFNAIRLDSADRDLRLSYYILGVQLYRNLERLAPDDSLRMAYADVKHSFRDSVLALVPGEKFIRANELIDRGEPEAALRLFADELTDTHNSKSNGAVYHIIARCYGKMGKPDEETAYLALAAEADLRNGVREYLALPQLALNLFQQGDIDRAYKYMQRSIEDARACGARVRMLDMTETLSTISEAYATRQQKARVQLGLLLILVVILLITAAISLFFLRQRNRLLSSARSHLEESNRNLETARRRLEESNLKLKSAGDIREKYVRRFMNLSRDYLEKLDQYRGSLFKIASKRNLEKLMDAIKSSEIIDTTTSTFYASFDKAFLELYPDFIAEFNSLLRPEERITPKYPGILNTDLRIFALMKLGIPESAEIARFLHCSQSTVYNYRTRYRSKAIDKVSFEEHWFLINRPN